MAVSRKTNKSVQNQTENPYINNLNIVYSEIKISKTYIYNHLEQIYLPATIKAEQQKKTSIFISPEHRKILMKLNPYANKLFLFIIYTIQTGEDIININRNIFLKESNLSRSTYIRAINELKELNIIKPVENLKDAYFINPAFLFNGSRLRKYPDKAKLYQKRTETNK